MKYTRGVSVLGFNAELELHSLDGRTHSLMSDCPEDLNTIMDMIADDAARKLAAYMEHLRDGHAPTEPAVAAHLNLCDNVSPENHVACTRRKGHDGKHQFAMWEWE